MAAGNREIPQLTRAHRVLIGVVVAGAVIIAGIGFAGSYAAVRELALEKGFGRFAYVFPIGIDAGICVLLALDLLLTWIRIPFPLLRQTAWLLTAATIAFNGAAAWPDPLGTGMHAVIPVLFVVAVEAARHAIGRIADITADKHMEGVRITRWLLSPGPTFLLWRRMKLWELRSYEQVIKLEQERLVYQARLRSRFGRAWRRKAPVESLMPLRLARYGVPLAETAPSGLAAAGIEPAVLPPAPVQAQPQPQATAPAPTPIAVPASGPQPELAAAPAPPQQPQTPALTEGSREPEVSPEEEAERFAEAYQAFIAQFHVEPTVAQWALWLRDAYGIPTGTDGLLSEEQVQPLLQDRYAGTPEELATSVEPQAENQSDQWYDYFHSTWHAYKQEHGAFPDAAALAAYVYERDAIAGDGGRPITGEDLDYYVGIFQEREFGSIEPDTEGTAADRGGSTAGDVSQPEAESEAAAAVAGAQAAEEGRTPRVNAAIDEPLPGPEEARGEHAVLTTVDRYYLAWTEYQAEHGDEPTDEQLSAYLAEKGMHGRGGGKPISPATLRRYFLPSRVYNVWAEYRMRNEHPAADGVAQECAARGITGQYNKPVTTHYITENAVDFERRWQALTRHHADAQQ